MSTIKSETMGSETLGTPPHSHLPVSQAATSSSAPTVAQLRHRAEVPMLIAGAVLTVGAVILVLFLALSENPLPEWVSGVLIGLLGPVLAWAVFIRWQYWSKIADGVQITPSQFPELWAVYSELAREMGFGEASDDIAPARMRTVPPLYLLNGNGVLNAYAAKCRTQTGYVVIHSDLAEIAYRNNDFSGVRFVLAHELGHIKCGHVSLWRMLFAPVLTLLRLYPSLSRAQEYTADRAACYYAIEGAPSMIVLFSGKNMYDKVDAEAYFDSVHKHKDGFWLKAANFMADHAVGFRRMTALRQAQEQGWDVHGKML